MTSVTFRVLIVLLLTIACAAGATERKRFADFAREDFAEDDAPADPPSDTPSDPPADPPSDPSDSPSDPPDSSPSPTDDSPTDMPPNYSPDDVVPDFSSPQPNVFDGWVDQTTDAGGDDGCWCQSGDGGTTVVILTPPPPSPPVLIRFSDKASNERSSRLSIKLSLAGWSGSASASQAAVLASLRTLTLTIGSASFTGNFGAHGNVVYSSGQSSFKGNVKPGSALSLNAKGFSLVELLSLNSGAAGPSSTVENLTLSATDSAGQVITFYSALTRLDYTVTAGRIKGMGSGS